MSGSVWIWQFLQSVPPETAEGAALGAGVPTESVPRVPFSAVAIRAVRNTKAKRSAAPGVIIWEHHGRRWFADLTTEEMVFEAPRSKQAKEIKARLERCRDLLPADLSAWMRDTVTDWGGFHLLGDLWLVPDHESAPAVLSMLRALPGAAVAALPLDGPSVAGEVLALLAGRMEAERGQILAEATGPDVLKPDKLRRMALKLRRDAESVAAAAGVFRIDLGALGTRLLEAEEAVRDKLGGKCRHSAPLDFTGSESSPQADSWTEFAQERDTEWEPSDADVKRVDCIGADLSDMAPGIVVAEPVDDGLDDDVSFVPGAAPSRSDVPTEGTYTRMGDPPPAAPPLVDARPIKVE